MDKISVFGELLYIGLVAEKGRCKSKGIWKYGYKRNLYIHMTMLCKICECIQEETVSDKDSIILREFLKFWKTESDIRRFYPIKPQALEELMLKEFEIFEAFDKKKYNGSISRLMSAMIKDVLELLDKGIFVNKSKISMLLKALHNLPRYYLGRNIHTLCELSQPSIEYEEAIEYSLQNMDEEARQKYQVYIFQ